MRIPHRSPLSGQGENRSPLRSSIDLNTPLVHRTPEAPQRSPSPFVIAPQQWVAGPQPSISTTLSPYPPVRDLGNTEAQAGRSPLSTGNLSDLFSGGSVNTVDEANQIYEGMAPRALPPISEVLPSFSGMVSGWAGSDMPGTSAMSAQSSGPWHDFDPQPYFVPPDPFTGPASPMPSTSRVEPPAQDHSVSRREEVDQTHGNVAHKSSKAERSALRKGLVTADGKPDVKAYHRASKEKTALCRGFVTADGRPDLKTYQQVSRKRTILKQGFVTADGEPDVKAYYRAMVARSALKHGFMTPDGEPDTKAYRQMQNRNRKTRITTSATASLQQRTATSQPSIFRAPQSTQTTGSSGAGSDYGRRNGASPHRFPPTTGTG